MPQYPWQVELPNLAQIYAGAAQITRTRMDIEDRQRALDANLKRAQAVKEYRGQDGKPGDPTALMLADPDLYAKLEGVKLSQGASQAAAARAEREQQPAPITSAEKEAFANYRAKVNPNATLQQAIDDPQWGAVYEQAKKDVMAGRKASAPQMIMNTGGQAPAKENIRALQREIIDNTQMLGTMRRINARKQPWMFTLTGKVKTGISGAAAWVNPGWVPKDATEEIKAKTQVRQDVKRMFSIFRRLITGAAASEKELKDLEAQMPNMDQNWIEFNASMDALFDELSSKVRLAQRVLSQTGGVPMTSEQLDAAITDAYYNNDKGNSDADITRRINNLEAMGRKPEAIVDQMSAEGYFRSADQARALLRALKQQGGG